MGRLFNLLFTTVAVSTSSAFAQTRCVVTENLLGNEQGIAVVNGAGWYVVGNKFGFDSGYILKGPSGYTRDLSRFTSQGTSDSTSPSIAAIGRDGSVYFAQWTDQDTNGTTQSVEMKIRKLAYESNSLSDFYSFRFNRDTTYSYDPRMNSLGYLAGLRTIKSGSKEQLIVYRFFEGRESQQPVTFPTLASSRYKNPWNKFLLGSGERYVVYQTSEARRKKKRQRDSSSTTVSKTVITGLCVSDVTSDAEPSCATPAVLNGLRKRGFTEVDLLGNQAILARTNPKTYRPEYIKLDFEAALSSAPIAIGPRNVTLSDTGVSFAANGDAHYLYVHSSFEQKNVTIVQHKADNTRTPFQCRLGKPFDFDIRVLLGLGSSFYPQENGGFLLFGSSKKQGKVLELTLQ